MTGFPVPRIIVDFPSQLKEFDEIIDARSPSEYAEDHLPNAINVPVLDDEERAYVGTLHKTDRLSARIEGAALISKNIAEHLKTHFRNKAADYKPLVYCWRGGQRSQSLALVLARVGWKTHVLDGGYRSYRRDLLKLLPEKLATFEYRILRGPTGTSKTRILRTMARNGFQVLDLEALANHKGSVLGEMPEEDQPSQKLFESRLLAELHTFSPDRPVWIEGEGSRIGAIRLPRHLVQQLREAQTVMMDVPIEERIKFIIEDYAYVMEDKEELKRTLSKLTKFLGGAKMDVLYSHIDADRWSDLVSILLKEHYDPNSRKFLDTNALRIQATVHCPTLSSDDVATLIQQLKQYNIRS